VGGQAYILSLTVDNGCDPLSSYNVTVPVVCGLTLPVPTTTLVLENNQNRIGANGTLYVVNRVNSRSYTPEKVTFIGQTGCHSVLASNWSATNTVQYSCPAPYTVRVLSVFPPVLTNKVDGQLVQITLSVGQGNGGRGNYPAGIPMGLLDDTLLRANDDSAVQIQVKDVNGTVANCEDPYITNYAAGQLVCTMVGATTLAMGNVVVDVRINWVDSSLLNANGVATVGPPVVTSISSTGTQGGVVTLTGHNLAFDFLTLNQIRSQGVFLRWSSYASTITINGLPCTNVTKVSDPVWFVSEATVSCNAPVGYGINLPVVVSSGFVSPYNDAILDVSAPAPIFTYTAPAVTALSPASGSPDGGYWVTATLSNFGPRWFTADGNPPPATVGTPYPDPYHSNNGSGQPQGFMSVIPGATTVYLLSGSATTTWTRTPVDMWYVSADETASTPATITFLMPPTCGPAWLWVARDANQQPFAAMTAGVSFGVENPTIKCIGEPYADATVSGCTRVALDGTNLGIPGDEPNLNITLWDNTTYMGACDDIVIVSANHRVTCRLPQNARPGHVFQYSNKCSQSTAVSTMRNGRALSTSSGSLGNSILVATCGTSYFVDPTNNDASFVGTIEPPVQPATGTARPASAASSGGGPASVNVTVDLAKGKWHSQPVSNGLFIGLFLPPILLLLIAYPLYVIISNRRGANNNAVMWTSGAAEPPKPATRTASTAAAGAAASSPTAARVASAQEPPRSGSRVVVNPVAASPAPVPGAAHDHL